MGEQSKPTRPPRDLEHYDDNVEELLKEYKYLYKEDAKYDITQTLHNFQVRFWNEIPNLRITETETFQYDLDRLIFKSPLNHHQTLSQCQYSDNSVMWLSQIAFS